MPRPKSDITGLRPKTLSVRWTEDQHVAYLRLGGSSWLRAAVDAEIKKHGSAGAIPRKQKGPAK